MRDILLAYVFYNNHLYSPLLAVHRKKTKKRNILTKIAIVQQSIVLHHNNV